MILEDHPGVAIERCHRVMPIIRRICDAEMKDVPMMPFMSRRTPQVLDQFLGLDEAGEARLFAHFAKQGLHERFANVYRAGRHLKAGLGEILMREDEELLISMQYSRNIRQNLGDGIVRFYAHLLASSF
jgi:hypothetical protein